MSRIASANLFDILGEDDAPEEVVAPAPAPAVAGGKGPAKKPVAAAVPAAAPPASARKGQQAKDAPAEEPNFNRQNRGAPQQRGGRPPREENKNDRHVARNGAGRDISKGGGGRGNWGGDLDENRARGPNSKKIAEEPVAEPEPLVEEQASPAPAEAAVVAPSSDGAAPAVVADASPAPAAPSEPEKPDPADKFIGFEEYMIQKEAKRVADDRNIKIRDVIVDDKQFKHIKVAVSEKDEVTMTSPI